MVLLGGWEAESGRRKGAGEEVERSERGCAVLRLTKHQRHVFGTLGEAGAGPGGGEVLCF